MSRPEDYFQYLRSVFEGARSSAGGEVVRTFQIAGVRLRFQFAGPVLEKILTPALAHLDDGSEAASDLTVFVWDSESTQTPPPRPAWSMEDHRERGEIRGFCDERFHTRYSIYSAVLIMVDLERAEAHFWVRCPERLELSERGAPFLTLLNFWFAQRGMIFMHSSAFGHEDGGLLLTGPGGSGKSSTALGAVEGGFSYASDDYCLVGFEPRITAYGIYNSAKLFADDCSRFPMLANPDAWYQDSSSDKALVYLHETHPEKLVSSLPVKVLLLPRVRPGPITNVQPATGEEALRALLPGMIPLPPALMRRGLEMLAQFARRVPCYHLHLGADKEAIPALLCQLLRTHDDT